MNCVVRIDRMIVMSSATFERCGSSSEISAPERPCFLNWNGERIKAALTIAESGGYRIRFPKGAACEGVLINTGGGMTGGDRMTVDAALLEDAEAVLTTQAAEKIYRSDGGDTEMAVSLALGRGSRLAWLPQEQILFDGGRFRRDLAVSMAEDARLTLVESVVFGRWARGEEVSDGTFRDRWRIRGCSS